ncbi:50S ribosomal protein L15 [Alphaproteobacteria bacterium]|nr:50S ribosomal protein L15 [Alphaproteobacteria bacterium]
MKLNEIRESAKARQGKKRVGRGMGSGLGKTSGRGGKGQTARSGTAVRGFEGGQMPIYRRLPKRGFTNPTRESLATVNLRDLQRAVDSGRLDAAKPVDLAALKAAGIVKGALAGARLTAVGDIKAKLTIDLNGASAAAKEKIEKAGGRVLVREEKPVVKKLPKKPAKPQEK